MPWKDPPFELSKTPRKKKITFYLSDEEARDLELLLTHWRKSQTDTCAILVKFALDLLRGR